jgi:hypothetical protein
MRVHALAGLPVNGAGAAGVRSRHERHLGTTTAPVLTLEVTSGDGCLTSVIRDVVIAGAVVGLQAGARCGCAQMRLNLAGKLKTPYCATVGFVDPPCFQIQVPAFLIELGVPQFCPDPRAQRALTTCRTGPHLSPLANGSLKLGWEFDVVSTLTPNTNAPAACGEGQYAQGTRSRGGKVFPVQRAADTPIRGLRIFPPAFPFVGLWFYPPFRFSLLGIPIYGSDSYTKPSDWKVRTARRIRWGDGPGFRNIPVNGPLGLVASQQDEFVSFVLGTAGQPSCWCRFRIQQAVVRLPFFGNVLLPARPQIVDGLNCTQ